MATVEERLETLEKRVQRYRKATLGLALLLVAGVTMAQTTRNATFDEVTCNKLTVVKGTRTVVQLRGWELGGWLDIYNNAGKITTSISQADGGSGLLYTNSSQGKELVKLSSTTKNGGTVTSYSLQGKELVILSSTTENHGGVTTYSSQGKELVILSSTTENHGGLISLNSRDGDDGVVISARGADDAGGYLGLYNKTGEEIVQLYADDYGNGVVGAWNRKGKGRTLEPGP